MKKKILAGLLITASVISCFAGCGADKGYTSYTGEKTGGKVLNIYAWNEEFKGFFEKYYKVPEGVKVNWVITPSDGGAYQEKLDKDLKAQKNAKDDDKIDMFLAEADYITKYVDSYVCQDVKALGVTDMSNTYDYTVQAVTGSDGAVKGVSFQCCPSALIYRRSIAKDVLGTDDPAEVQKKLDSWEKFDAVAAEAKAKGYYMTPSYVETFRTFSNNVSKAWVDDKNNLQFDDNILAWVKQAKEYLEKGYTLPSNIWEDQKNQQMFATGKTMCLFGPAWYYNFCMGNAQDPDKGCYGDWAICEGPMAHFWGGTWLIVANGSDNTDIVADIMNTFINDEEVVTNLVKKENQFSNNKKVNETVAADPSYGNAFLGGQNDTAVYVDLAKNIKFENRTKYDQLLNEGLPGQFLDYFKGTITEEKAYENFYKYVNEKYPDIKTPNK